MKKISIIIPAYNEEESLPLLYDRLKKLMEDMKNYEFEILFVNDGSKDKTIEIIKEFRSKDERICYVDFSRNFGKEIAMIAGLDYATGDCVIFMDADLQDPPELIPQMIQLWEQGNEIIYAKRKKRKGESPFKLLSAKLFYQILNALYGEYNIGNIASLNILHAILLTLISIFVWLPKISSKLVSYFVLFTNSYEYVKQFASNIQFVLVGLNLLFAFTIAITLLFSVN